ARPRRRHRRPRRPEHVSRRRARVVRALPRNLAVGRDRGIGRRPGMTAAEAPRYPRVTLAAACIPWNERGDVMEDVFRDQVRLHLEAGVKHIYIFGTAGEGYAVTERLFDEIVHLFTSEMR